MGFRYLQHEQSSSRFWLLPSLFLYALAGMYMEQVVFFLPVMIIGYMGFNRLGKRHIRLITPLLAIGFASLILILTLPRSLAVPWKISAHTAFERISFYFLSFLPIPKSWKGSFWIPAVITAGLIAAGFCLTFLKPHFTLRKLKSATHLSGRLRALYVFLFPAALTACNLFAFIFMSKLMTSRYGYIAGFGFYTLLIFSLYTVSCRIFKKKSIPVLILAAVLACSGMIRLIELTRYFNRINASQHFMLSRLESIVFPFESQIIINLSQEKLPYRGEFWNSSGHLMYMLKRRDILGAVIYPGNLPDTGFDPFTHYSSSLKMLSPIRPLFIFRESEGNLLPVSYFLRWIGRKKGAQWTVFQLDPKTGDMNPAAWGRGAQSYRSALKKMHDCGVDASRILWGNPPDNNNKTANSTR